MIKDKSSRNKVERSAKTMSELRSQCALITFFGWSIEEYYNNRDIMTYITMCLANKMIRSKTQKTTAKKGSPTSNRTPFAFERRKQKKQVENKLTDATRL